MSLITRADTPGVVDRRSRLLPSTAPAGYAIGSTEPVGAALRRTTTDQFTVAIGALAEPSPDLDLDLATFVAREALTRVAAALRLVRTSIGDDVYRTEITVLREIDERLADLVAGEGELRALDELRMRYAEVLRPETFAGFRDDLVHHHRLGRLQALAERDTTDALPRILQRLRRARARFAAWPAEGDVDTLARGGGVPVPDSFDALVDGLERSYRRGQRRWEAAAKGKRVNVRRWARDVTDLGHQLELVAAAWPGMVSAWVAVCRNLGTALADDLGHAALARTAERGTPPLDDVEHALLTSLSAHARGELASIATALGTRIYAESPSDFAARIGSYWNTRA